MPPAHCGVAYLAYRTLLTNGAIYSQAAAAAAVAVAAALGLLTDAAGRTK